MEGDDAWEQARAGDPMPFQFPSAALAMLTENLPEANEDVLRCLPPDGEAPHGRGCDAATAAHSR